MKFLSSIFSSEALQSTKMPRGWWASIALLILILVSAEIGARILLKPVGDNLWAYDSTVLSRSFEWYRQLSENEATPAVVAIGDSTGARNFDPVSFASASSIDSVYSLARAGNFPRALRNNTLPLLDNGLAPEIVILLQWPGSFVDDPRVDQIEAGAVSPILEARRTGRFLLTNYLHVARLFRAREYLVSHWIRGEPLVQPSPNGGFAPLHRKGPGESTAILPARTPTATVVFSEKRRQVTMELLDLAQYRQFLVVAVVGPFRSGMDYDVANEHLRWLKSLEADTCEVITVIDFRDLPGFDSSRFRDNAHLYRDGAEEFSARLGMVIAKIQKERADGKSGCAN